MSKITRYVLTQLILSFIVTLLGMTFVLVFGIMVKEGLRQGLGLGAILRLLPYALPSALRFSVPASLLLATCSVYGRMSADNEVVASKSLGISPSVILFPAVILGAAISMSMIWLNDVAVTWGATGMQSVIAESVEDVVFRLLKTERSFRNGYLEIYVKDVEGERLIEPRIKLHNNQNLVAYAREAELKTDLQRQVLELILTDCKVSGQDASGRTLNYTDPGVRHQQIPLSQATKRDARERRVSELGLGEISNQMIQQQERIRATEQQLAARAALHLVTGNFASLGDRSNQPDGTTWNALYQKRRDSKNRLNRLRLEPWRRFAEGFSCLSILVLGAPLAIRMKTNNFFTTFAMCFFPVLCVYYPILQWTVEQVKDGGLPPYSVWLGNIVLFFSGSWVSRSIVRY